MSTEMKNVPAGRVVSIDALRGFDMLWITGGASVLLSLVKWLNLPFAETITRQFDHSSWNGFTFYDLIFPLFLFIVGASMPFSISKRLERGDSRKDLYVHIFKRALTLFVLGLVHNKILDFNFGNFRWAGVLQRISLCSLFAGIIVMNFKIKGQAITAGAILLLYWGAMALIPVPGFGSGALTPEGNLASYIDRLFLPGRFCCFEFGDNEGILSTIPAIATTLLGVLSGHWLRTSQPQGTKVLRLAAVGVACLVVAGLWSIVFPINKLIWTSSYVLYAGGWSMLLLALFYWIIDVRGYQRWAFFFVVIGLNPITIYVAQSLFNFGIIADIFIHGFVDHLGAFKPFFVASCVLAVKWLFLFFLYKQKIFLKA